MPNALLTGVSGLVAHQRMLDVVSNNLANMNTVGYKARRTLFADLFYATLQPATFPNQIGTGTRVGQVTKNFSQGNSEQTGELFDFAIQGDGFFVFDTGEKTVYGRGGAFGLDDEGYLVDPGSGYRVVRFGTAGEGDDTNPGFQVRGLSWITVPFGASIPGESTTEINFVGNLNAASDEPQAEVLTSVRPFRDGGVAATSATLLNALDSNATPYIAGDVLEITGTDFDGTAIATTLAVTAATTIGDLVAAIDAAYPGSTATLSTNGEIVLTANTEGETVLDLRVADAAGNTGGTDWVNHLPVVTTAGAGGGKFSTVIEVFDVRGGAHSVRLTFEKQGANNWNLTASMDASDGTISDNLVEGIRFNDNGSLQQVVGTGLGNRDLVFAFDGVTDPQTIRLSFGDDNSFEGLTQLATDSGLAIEQDGFAPGTMNSVNTGPDGTIYGIATNGRQFPIAQLALASFRNTQGLRSVGDNYFEESLNTGDVQLGTALSGDRGAIVAGQLETSNVEVAQEFTRLIVAQRGFSANARTITVADKVLEELTNIIR